MTFPIYKRMCLAVTRRKKNLACAAVSAALLALAFLKFRTGPSLPAVNLALSGLLFPVLVHVFYLRSIRKTFDSTRAAQGLMTRYSFFRDRFTAQNQVTSSSIRYDQLYRVLEDDAHFYLLIGDRQAFVLEKQNCSEGLPEFLRGLKKSGRR